MADALATRNGAWAQGRGGEEVVKEKYQKIGQWRELYERGRDRVDEAQQ